MNNYKCFKCRFFDRYYTKGLRRFDLTEIGYCEQKKEIMQKNESCEKFVQKQCKTYYRTFTARTLSNLLTEISEIRKVIEAGKAENEEL